MLDRLKEIFADRGTPADDLEEPQAGALAAAMLLLEVAWADHDIAEAELRSTRGGLKRLFQLDDAEVDAIIARARRDHEQSTSMYPFTRALNQHLSMLEKRELVSMLWRLAYTDAVLTGHEEHTIRRIADLLYLSHQDFISAKQRGRANAKKRN